MTHPYGDGRAKQEFAALAVNRCVYEIINACKSGERIKDRCRIGVIGYGKTAGILLAGTDGRSRD